MESFTIKKFEPNENHPFANEIRKAQIPVNRNNSPDLLLHDLPLNPVETLNENVEVESMEIEGKQPQNIRSPCLKLLQLLKASPTYRGELKVGAVVLIQSKRKCWCTYGSVWMWKDTNMLRSHVQ